MRQCTAQAIDPIVRYRHLEVVALSTSPERTVRHLLESALLFMAACALWGLVVFVALTAAVR